MFCAQFMYSRHIKAQTDRVLHIVLLSSTLITFVASSGNTVKYNDVSFFLHFILSCVKMDHWCPCWTTNLHANPTHHSFTHTYLHWRYHLSPAWWCRHCRGKSSGPIFHSSGREFVQNHLIITHTNTVHSVFWFSSWFIKSAVLKIY